MNAPDVLVLGGGGLLGEVWMNAVLAGMHEADGFDARESQVFIGTSAGSIVAAALAAGTAPRERLGELGGDPAPDQAPSNGTPFGIPPVLQTLIALGATAASPLTSLALRSGAAMSAGALVRRAALARVPAGRRSLDRLADAVERLNLQWDGRLLIAAVDLHSGRRVMFGAPGSRHLAVAQAVQASCAIPGVFAPVRSGGRTFVDGGVWSPTNMDAAEVRRGTRVVCLNPTGSIRPSAKTPAGALGTLSRAVAAAEALALRGRGATAEIVNPDDACRRAMGINLLDPRPRAAVIAAGLQQGRQLARR